jgi:hypothetical protein
MADDSIIIVDFIELSYFEEDYLVVMSLFDRPILVLDTFLLPFFICWN